MPFDLHLIENPNRARYALFGKFIDLVQGYIV